MHYPCPLMPHLQTDSLSFRHTGTNLLNSTACRTAGPVAMTIYGCLPWMPTLAHNPLMVISTIDALSVPHVSRYLVDTSVAMPSRRMWVFSNGSQSSEYLAAPRRTGYGIRIGTDRYTGEVRERRPLVTQSWGDPARYLEFSCQATLESSSDTRTMPTSCAIPVNAETRLMTDNAALVLSIPRVLH